MELNIKTLYLIGGIVTVAGAGAALLTWYHHRTAPGLRAWAAALLLTVLGALILRLRTSHSDLTPVLAANMVIVAGFAAMWLSLRFANHGRTDFVRLIVVAVGISAAFLALFIVLRASGVGQRAASIPFSLLLGLLGLACAWEVWQGRQKDDLRSRLPAALAFVGLGVARVIRAGVLGFEVIQLLPAGAAAATHPYTLYATIVLTLAVTYGLVMMANEQAGRREAMQFAQR